MTPDRPGSVGARARALWNRLWRRRGGAPPAERDVELNRLIAGLDSAPPPTDEQLELALEVLAALPTASDSEDG